MTQTVTVHIPGELRPQVDNNATVEMTGSSVRQVLKALRDRYPVLGKRLFKNDEELNHFVNIYLNEEDIRFLENLETPTRTGDELSIVPAIAGG